uniref:High mobility group box 3a n=1 Tax=Cyprinus carpio TaxID=7962 RepID=A0A8C1G1C5_CYPCA
MTWPNRIRYVAKKLGEMWNSLTDGTKQPYLIKANKLKDKYQKDVADYKTKGKVGAVSMGMGMMGNCMAPKPMMKSNMDDEEDDEEEEDEEEDDDEYDDDE